MRALSFIFFFLLCCFAQAQTIVNINGVPRDTSFTVHATYTKEVKYRPYIKIVEPEYNDNIKWNEGVTYSRPTLGRELKLNIYRPKDNKKYPALLMVHSGGWASGDLSLQIPMAQKIAEKGYVTIPVEYRLSPEAMYPAAVYDLKTAVRWARANADTYNIDTTHIAISGCSAGGQLAALIGTTNEQAAYEGCGEYQNYSSSVHAVVNIDGSCDFTIPESIERVNTDVAKGKRPAAVRWLGGTYSERKGNWIAASPVYHVTEKSVPICFINSSIPRFHDGRDEIVAELTKYSIFVEIYTIEDTPHPFWLLHPWFDRTVMYITGFLDKHLKTNINYIK